MTLMGKASVWRLLRLSRSGATANPSGNSICDAGRLPHYLALLFALESLQRLEPLLALFVVEAVSMEPKLIASLPVLKLAS